MDTCKVYPNHCRNLVLWQVDLAWQLIWDGWDYGGRALGEGLERAGEDCAEGSSWEVAVTKQEV